MDLYVDTSALAKWYLNEPRSEDFEAFIRGQREAAISRLTVVELRCLLARRRRARELTKAIESRVFASFERDIGAGFLHVHPVADQHVVAASGLIARLRRFSLRTLDALHLAIALETRCRRMATADRIMAGAGKAAGLLIVRFD